MASTPGVLHLPSHFHYICYKLCMAHPIPPLLLLTSDRPQVQRFARFANVYGTLDEQKIGRDRIPDMSVGQLCVRPLLILRYDASAKR